MRYNETGNVCIRVTLEALSCNNFYNGKAIGITYSECVFVALGIQRAMHLLAPYCYVWPVRLYNIFSTLSHKPHDFRKKVTEHKMCVLIFSTTFVRNISRFKIIKEHLISNVPKYSCKLPVIRVRF